MFAAGSLYLNCLLAVLLGLSYLLPLLLLGLNYLFAAEYLCPSYYLLAAVYLSCLFFYQKSKSYLKLFVLLH